MTVMMPAYACIACLLQDALMPAMLLHAGSSTVLASRHRSACGTRTAAIARSYMWSDHTGACRGRAVAGESRWEGGCTNGSQCTRASQAVYLQLPTRESPQHPPPRAHSRGAPSQVIVGCARINTSQLAAAAGARVVKQLQVRCWLATPQAAQHASSI